MELRVAIRIFDDREQKHLSHILSLASKRGEVPMLTASAASADVIFIKKDEPGASVFLQPGRAEKLPIAVLYDDEASEYCWHLRKPATSTELIPLLKNLQDAVSALPRLAATDVSSPATGNGREQPLALIPTVSGQTLLNRLSCCDGKKTIWCVQIDLSSHFVIDSRNRLVYAPARYLEMPGALLDILMVFRDADYVEISESELTPMLLRAGSALMTRIPFEQFAWMACHYAEPQLPIPPGVIDTMFRLQRWPSFTRLKHTQRHMQWSGRLMKGAASLAQLTMGAVEDMADAAKFYNACMVGGLAVIDSSGEEVAVTAVGNGEKTGVFGRILKRLMG